MREGNLKRNIGALLVLQGAGYLLPLVTLPYLVRVLGPDIFGRIAFAQAFVAYFVFLTDYGFNLTATRTVARSRNDLAALSRLASAVMVAKSVIMIAGFIVLLVTVSAVPSWRADWSLFAWAYLSVIGSVMLPAWLFQGLERLILLTVYALLAKLIMVVATFALVREAADYHVAAALQGAGMIVAGVLGNLHLRRVASFAWRWPGMNAIRQVTKEGWHVFLASFAGNVANSSNVFFLGLAADPMVVGYFAAAEKLIRAVQGLIYPVSQAVYARVANLRERSYDEALTLVSNMARAFFVGGACVSVLVFLFASEITVILYGEKFHVTAELIRLMAIIPFLVALNNILGAQTLAQFGFTGLLSASTLIPVTLHVALLYFVAAHAEAAGVALLIVLTELLIFVIRAFWLGRQQPGMLKRIMLG